MSDHPIPAELVDHIARLGLPASGRRPDALDRQRAWNMLQALSEWADGGLIDPSTWTVVEATERGVDYCTEHHGIRNEDEDACDFSEGGGSGECVLAPLYTLSPREGER